jgi:hypothetical protein
MTLAREILNQVSALSILSAQPGAAIKASYPWPML